MVIAIIILFILVLLFSVIIEIVISKLIDVVLLNHQSILDIYNVLKKIKEEED